MCGFTGVLYNSSIPTDLQLNQIQNMTDSIKHRGPDDRGYYTDNNISLGFARLSIIDIEGGSQPMKYEEAGLIIVFNGEIYNYLELREFLKNEGYNFETNSDTEVILKLYKHLGKKVVEHVRGMFTFVIYDSNNKEIFGARDCFGIKHLYYSQREDGFYFASEKKALVEFLISDNVNIQSLQHYLSFQYVPEPMTLSENIYKLEAGCCFYKSKDSEIIIEKYFIPRFSPIVKDYGVSKKIRDALIDSVRLHMQSDVPLGSFLSGGIDSTAIAAIAKEFKPDLKTFTAAFEDKNYSELEVAKESAYRLGVENIHYIVGVEEYIKELPKIIYHMDDPVADPSIVPLYFVAREAAKHVKVVLSGEGSDELFGGYGMYNEPLSLRPFNYIPRPIKHVLKILVQIFPEGIKGKGYIERGCTPLRQRYIGNAKMYQEKDKRKLLKKYLDNVDYTCITSHLYDDANNYDDITAMQYIDVNTWLRGDILMKADKMTMAHSLELRVPFLDREVFKIASTLHPSIKLTKGTTKYILREALRGIVPDHVVDRKKLGFPVPIKHWLKDELYDWAVNLINQSQTDYLINKSFVLKQLEQHRKGRLDLSRRIWTVLTFMIWHQVFIEKVYKEWGHTEQGKETHLTLG